ncbi:uncharacterized protein (DUF305 family) [Kineococcus xinjiangensis]|uniref:Uncharacterized protein (DUF305 family) n=1 Tax=Kineococcus xinjiangensis TaxID=512762 RepID=A0A2S6IMG5_9ACTN|nr:DUF305 domain-containing protein [Kineococcus xinjiangensis]PPK95346.1 uncharacterized protein (DUF305 family) [Kineococcus xinjiangensis]
MTITPRLLGAGAALLAGALLTGCGTASPELPPLPAPAPAAPVAAAPSGPVAAVSPADTEFVQQVLARHQRAVDLAGLAVARASDPQTRALAEDLVRVHGWEMTEAATWLQTQNALAAAPVDEDPAAGTAVGALLEVEGEAFDRLFLDLVAEHHRATIELAQAQQKHGRDADARNLAWLVDEGRTGELQRITALQQAS